MGINCSKKDEDGVDPWDKYVVDDKRKPSNDASPEEGVRFGSQMEAEGPRIDWEALEKETQALNLRYLREDFKRNPDQFLVNLILMSVQFFKHFEKDRESLLAQRDTLKNKFDDEIVDLKKNTILWDGYFSKIQDYVSFQEDGSGKFDPIPLEALQGQECYFCYNNIDTNRHEEFHSLRDGSSQYSQLDNPIYRVCLEPADHAGFVKVRCVDDPSMFTPRQTSSTESQDEDQEDDESDEDEDTLHVQHPKPPSIPDVHVRPINLGFNIPPPKVSFGEDIIEEEEEEGDDEDGPSADFMMALGRKVNVDSENYLVKPIIKSPTQLKPQPNFTEVPKIFQPSLLEVSRSQPGSREDPNNMKRSERRPSGFMPEGWVKQEQILKLRELRNRAISNEGTIKVEPKEKTKKAIPEEDDDTYGYAYTKPIPLSMGQMGENRRVSNSIPDSCFQTREVQIVEDEDTDPYPIDAELEKRIYLSSKRFMWHFTNQFYEIASRIGKRSLTGGAKSLGPAVICMEEIENTYKELMWKFIPSVEVGFWPDEGLEWLLRRRKAMRDRRTGVTYQWPERHQVEAAKQIGCNIVPIGFHHPKKNINNADVEVEWRVEFTKAEMIIVKNLHHPKVRVLMFAILLYKSFFEKIGAVDATHIKYIFYWLVEQSPGDWTEENIGEKFLLVMKFLKKHVTSQKMPNYFISKSNMFANIPNHKLREAQEKIHRVQEKPVFYLMDCLMKLKYEKNFYPMPEFARLYKILTTDSQLSLLNPNLLGPGAAREEDKVAGKRPGQDRYQEKMRAFREKIEAEAKKARKQKEGKKKIIDFNADVKPFDEIRGKLILEFFIAHFLKMASKSNEFRNSGQGLMYVLQAENLMTILKDIGFDETLQTQEFRQDIFRLKEVSRFSIREYWNINYGHGGLSHKQSFQIKRSHLEGPLPPVPSTANSPVIGVEKPKTKTGNGPRKMEAPPLLKIELPTPRVQIQVELHEDKDDIKVEVHEEVDGYQSGSKLNGVIQNAISEEDEIETIKTGEPRTPFISSISISEHLDDSSEL